MKKVVYLFAIVGFFIAGIQSANAQWKYNVSWNDTECNCGTINEKTMIVLSKAAFLVFERLF